MLKYFYSSRQIATTPCFLVSMAYPSLTGDYLPGKPPQLNKQPCIHNVI